MISVAEPVFFATSVRGILGHFWKKWGISWKDCSDCEKGLRELLQVKQEWWLNTRQELLW